MDADKKIEMDAKIAPYLEQIRALKSKTYTLGDVHSFERDAQMLKNIRTRITDIKAKAGEIVGYDCISDDKDDRYGCFSPKVTYTIGAGLHCLFKYAPSHLDSCYDLHEWLVKIGAVRKDTRNDHESGCLFYYLSSRKSAEAFIDRINKKVQKFV